MTEIFNILPLTENLEEQAGRFILNILENEYKFTGRKRLDLEDISGYYQEGRGNFWVALIGDEIVGTIAVKDCGDGRGYLKRFLVKSSLRGRGLGKQLFAILLQAAKTSGLTELYLGVSEGMDGAVPFYERHGFRRIESLPSDFPRFSDTMFYKLTL